ncbi:MAG: STAS domain-containing protein [Pseudomonas sp.]|uniref:STAS domain-containing protein n=1 Tax=Pseudomonas sp. TaxID=306 RepID=UPI0030F0ABAD
MAALGQHAVQKIKSAESQLLQEWIASLEASGATRNLKDSELKAETKEFLGLLSAALEQGAGAAIGTAQWEETRQFLDRLSRSRAQQGQDSSQTATFIFALKGPLFALLQNEFKDQAELLAEQVLQASELFDALGLHTIRTFQASREAVIRRQQEELLELSTPVVKLWDGVLALPMIGTLDSQRTQVVMESLLQRIVDTGSEIAIIDITGVPTVDTLVAQHLLKTVTAIRLMGADCIISGVRPQIAQTIVHLGLDLQGVVTKANLADALSLALRRLGVTVTKAQ